MASRLKVVAKNKKTGNEYIFAEVDEKMPHMAIVMTKKHQGVHNVYSETVEFLSEEKQYFT